MTCYTYILRCADGSLYTGVTSNLSRRFSEHCGASGKGAKYTAAHRPVCFEAAWECTDRPRALSLEYRIKSLTRAEKLALIGGNACKRLDVSGFRRLEMHEYANEK